jgi:hypothetical protein
MERDPSDIYRSLTPEFGAPSEYPQSMAALVTLYLQGPRTYTAYLLW